MYAILDIETTGGKYNEEGITEIAIYRFDGHEVVDKFISLVNPEREIQPFVVNLTGINNKMLRNAPKFYEIAKRVVEITEGCIIVAHNAEFDYRILKTEFKRLGFPFVRKTLCTVELSQELIPEQESYSLGKLTRSLGIPVSERHRANGDAMATVKLFKMLLSKDVNKKIIKENIKEHKTRVLDKNHIEMVEALPAVTGVYYLHDKNGSIFFIGKSRNIKHRVNQHLTNTNRKSKKIQLLVKSVSHEETGSELVAILKKNEEVKTNKPKLNPPQKKQNYSHGLYCFVDDKGYKNLNIQRISKSKKNPITTFVNLNSAQSYLTKICQEYDLCPKLVGLKSEIPMDFEESPQEYNQKVSDFVSKTSFTNKNLAIVDKGRNVNERSVIYIKDGSLKGLGFTELNHQIINKSILESLITPMENKNDTIHIIQSYLRKNKRIKIIPIS
ncbi:MAG: exonuclease domain-containing protein [Bacteroidota bacterium]